MAVHVPDGANGVVMNHAPQLSAEDRPDFGRTLDEALRDGALVAALRERETRLNAEQLRTKALFDQDTVAAAAAQEYRHYTGLREALREAQRQAGSERPAPTAPRPVPATGRTRPQTTGELLAQLHPENGGGPWPVLTVLVPILAIGAAVVLLLLGYVLDSADAQLTYAHSVILAGWAAVAAAAGSLVIGLVGLVLTALRDGSAGPDGADPDLRNGVAEARTVWLAALRDRAILPYLLANLDSEPALGPPPPRERPPTAPEFTSPGYTSAAFGSPGFSSPGPDENDPARPTEFSSPGYSPPGFTSPDDV